MSLSGIGRIATLTSAEVPELGNDSIRYWAEWPAWLRVDPAAPAIEIMAAGIVDWSFTDEAGRPVTWDRARGADLINGIPHEAFIALLDRIGQGGTGDAAQ